MDYCFSHFSFPLDYENKKIPLQNPGKPKPIIDSSCSHFHVHLTFNLTDLGGDISLSAVGVGNNKRLF